MGYNLTYFLDIPHGKADGLLLHEYLKFNYGKAEEKIDMVLKSLNISSIDELGCLMEILVGKMPDLGMEDIEKYSDHTMVQRSTGFNIRDVNKQDIMEIYKKALL
jgi:alcohol dehydrogenase class IV